VESNNEERLQGAGSGFLLQALASTDRDTEGR
jgi:hypothetical protein